MKSDSYYVDIQDACKELHYCSQVIYRKIKQGVLNFIVQKEGVHKILIVKDEKYLELKNRKKYIYKHRILKKDEMTAEQELLFDQKNELLSSIKDYRKANSYKKTYLKFKVKVQELFPVNYKKVWRHYKPNSTWVKPGGYYFER